MYCVAVSATGVGVGVWGLRCKVCGFKGLGAEVTGLLAR